MDRAGNALAAGRGVARKIAGGTGAEIWRADLGLITDARAIVVDSQRDVVVGGEGAGGAVFTVVKLTGNGRDF